MSDIGCILYLEDDLDIAKLTQEFLDMYGLKIDHAANCKSAIEKFNEGGDFKGLFRYDALLLDFNLPDGNGSDIAMLARENGYDKIIVMYSSSIFKTKDACVDLENIQFVFKPTDTIDNLLLALRGQYTE